MKNNVKHTKYFELSHNSQRVRNRIKGQYFRNIAAKWEITVN